MGYRRIEGLHVTSYRLRVWSKRKGKRINSRKEAKKTAAKERKDRKVKKARMITLTNTQPSVKHSLWVEEIDFLLLSAFFRGYLISWGSVAELVEPVETALTRIANRIQI